MSKAINKIEKILESINYEEFFIEIKTKNGKYTIEKKREHEILGFLKENR